MVARDAARYRARTRELVCDRGKVAEAGRNWREGIVEVGRGWEMGSQWTVAAHGAVANGNGWLLGTRRGIAVARAGARNSRR